MTSKETTFLSLFLIVIFFGYHWARNLMTWASKEYKNKTIRSKKSHKDINMVNEEINEQVEAMFDSCKKENEKENKKNLRKYKKDPVKYLKDLKK